MATQLFFFFVLAYYMLQSNSSDIRHVGFTCTHMLPCCSCLQRRDLFLLFSSFLLDVDECVSPVCEEQCVNTPGSFRCFCDGRQGKKLRHDLSSCEVMRETRIKFIFFCTSFLFYYYCYSSSVCLYTCTCTPL